MKAIELIRTNLKDAIYFASTDVTTNVVCGTLERKRWYYKESTPTWGKADCVILGADKQPVYLYLIEE
jgi:hypothetical protein